MYSLLVVLAVVVSLLLCLIVLIQESKGGGLASNFASSNQIMGVRKTTDVVEKSTWTLAGLLVLICIATTFVTPVEKDPTLMVTDMQTTTTVPTLPGAPTSPAAQTPAESANN